MKSKFIYVWFLGKGYNPMKSILFFNNLEFIHLIFRRTNGNFVMIIEM